MEENFIVQGRHLSLQQRARRVLIMFAGFGYISLTLQMAGIWTRGWLIMKVNGGVKCYGLWTVRYCIGGRCSTRGTIEDGTDLMSTGLSLVTLEEFKMETVLAIAFLVLTLVILASCSWCCKPYNIKGGVYISALAALLSGILALVASLQLFSYYRVANAVYTDQQGESPLEIPYSAILTGFGGLLAIVPVPAVPFYLRPWRCEFDPRLVDSSSNTDEDDSYIIQ